MRIARTVLAFFLLGALLPGFAGAVPAANAELEVHRVALESTLETRLERTLAVFLGSPEVLAHVKVSIHEKSVSGASKKADDDYMLPGVPVEQKFQPKTAAPVFTLMDRRIKSVVWVGMSVPDKKIEEAREIAASTVDFDPKGGDTLEFKRMSFSPAGPSKLRHWAEFATAIALLLAAFALMWFLIGPTRTFFRDVTDALLSGTGGGSPVTLAAPAATSGGGRTDERSESGPSTGAATGSPEEEPLFTFINKDNIGALVKTLASERGSLVLSVLESLPRAIASKAFQMLPPEIRANVVLEAKNVRYGNPEHMRRIEAKIRSLLGFSYGGIRKISRIVQGTDRELRGELVEAVRKLDPQTADELRGNLLEFEDLLEYNDRDFSRIFRDTGLVTLARLIKASPKPLTESVAAKLTPEVAELLREQVSVLAPLSHEVGEEELLRIVNVVERLRAEGMIEAAEEEAQAA